MSDKKMLDDQINIAIAQKTAALVDKSDIRRSELARSLSIAAPTVTQMLSGITPLPLERYFQIVNIVKASRREINDIFALYMQKFSIPAESIAMLDGGWINQRYEQLLKIPDDQLTEINRKELEVIRYWNGETAAESITPVLTHNAKLQEYVRSLDESQSEKALSMLKLMFEK